MPSPRDPGKYWKSPSATKLRAFRREERNGRRPTQQEIARRTGYDRSAIARFESGARKIPRRFCELFQRTYDYRLEAASWLALAGGALCDLIRL